MRIPVASERDAFRWVFGIACVLLVAVLLGAITEPVIGVVLLVGAVLGVVGWELLSRDPNAPSALREASNVGRTEPDASRHHVLVVANETVTGQELREEMIQRLKASSDVRVVCPILPSRAHYIASDTDRELAEARDRLERTLAWASDRGLAVTGHASPETPLQAIIDELRVFPADELILSTHPPERSKWLESGLVERLRAELEIPVHHVVVDMTQQPEPAPIT